jgi:hypothetical protein
MKYIGSKGESRYAKIDRYVLKPQIIQESLSIIRSIWQRLPDERRPWGVWISYHEPIAVSARTDTNVISACLFYSLERSDRNLDGTSCQNSLMAIAPQSN